jgi:hypothetical protein
MALFILYLVTRSTRAMLLGSLRSQHGKDVAIAVLGHQLTVLQRQVKRPEFPTPTGPAGRSTSGQAEGVYSDRRRRPGPGFLLRFAHLATPTSPLPARPGHRSGGSQGGIPSSPARRQTTGTKTS